MAEYEENTVIETEPTDPEIDGGRSWLRLAILIAAVIIVALLLIFAARWVYHAITDDNRSTTSVQTPAKDKIPAAPGEQKKNNTSTGSEAKSGTSSTSSTQTGTSSSSSSTQTNSSASENVTQLPNSGPAENMAAIVAASAVTAAGAHYVISRKRTN